MARFGVDEVKDVILFDKTTGKEVMKLDTAVVTYEPVSVPTIKQHELDIDKIQTIEDVKAVLKALDIKVYSFSEQYKKLKPYLKEVE